MARTERYFCPIEHAQTVLGLHARHARLLDHGDAADYPARRESFRQSLKGRDAGVPEASVSK